MKTSFAIAALIAPVMTLGACSSDVRLSVPEVPSEVRASSSYPSLEVRLVSLPTYAGEETVATQNADGTITANDSLLWADDPARSLTMVLAVTAAKRDKVKGLRTQKRAVVTDHRALLHWIAKNDQAAITTFVEDYAAINFRLGAMDGVEVKEEKVPY